ncbi:MAG: hypothetical protein HY675_05530 [Chloroflexi bacterium]|nr:hypothetical protein [Chloroflexota bacterium]
MLLFRLKGLRVATAHRRLYTTATATLGVAVMVMVSTYFGLAPEPLTGLQSWRWMSIVGILLAILGALGVEAARGRGYARITPALAAAGIAVYGFLLARGELPPVVTKASDLPIARTLGDDGISYADKLVSATGFVPDLSYYLFGKVRLAGNYFAQAELDTLYPALMWLLLSDEAGSTLQTGDPTLALAYLKAVGGTLLLVDENEAVARAMLPGGKLGNAVKLRYKSAGFVLFELPRKPPQAFITSTARAKSLAFPNVSYDTEVQKKHRDQFVLRFSQAMEAPETIIPKVSYPSQTGIRILASDIPRGSYLIVLAPFQRSWEITVNGVAVQAEPAGPHYVGVDLAHLTGTIEVDLRHGIDWAWKVSWALVAIAVVATFILGLRGCIGRSIRS